MTRGICVNYHGQCSEFERRVGASEGDGCGECGHLLLHESGLTWADARDKEVEVLRERLVVLGVQFSPIRSDVVRVGWKPGFVVALGFTDPKLDGLRGLYAVGPSGPKSLVQVAF